MFQLEGNAGSGHTHSELLCKNESVSGRKRTRRNRYQPTYSPDPAIISLFI